MQLLFCCQNLVGWFARRRRNGHKSCELFNYVTIIKDNTIRIKRQGKRYTTKSNGLGRQRSSSIRGAIPLYIKQAPAVTLSHSLVHWLATIRSPELNFRNGGGGLTSPHGPDQNCGSLPGSLIPNMRHGHQYR